MHFHVRQYATKHAYHHANIYINHFINTQGEIYCKIIIHFFSMDLNDSLPADVLMLYSELEDQHQKLVLTFIH